MNKQKIKDILLTIPALKKYYVLQKEKKGLLIKTKNFNLEVANKILLDSPWDENILVGLVKDELFDFDGYTSVGSYNPKYERFLNNNNIKYEYIDIHRHDWLEQASRFNVIIWHTSSSPVEQNEAMQKIYFLEKLGIKCLPSFDEVFKYENKVVMHYFYSTNNLPEIPTFVSYSTDDAYDFAVNTKYPIISKITTGSASFGVTILRSKRKVIKMINRVFDYNGMKTYWRYAKQKDYVYFQKFINDAEYDLRIIVVGDSLFGYYRYPDKGDFRASGAGNYEKKAIPVAALDLAWETKIKYEAHCLATDFLYSPKENKYYIIESSIFIGVETAMQLIIDGIPGRYKRSSDGKYTFKEGKYWIQELALKSFFESMQ